MSHYEERLEQDVKRIRSEVALVGKWVEAAVRDALRSVLTLDRELAYETILGDKRVNRAVAQLDSRCHSFVARHLPSAKHLRFISSVLRMNVALERTGDYATTICREAAQIQKPLEPSLHREVERMGENVSWMLHQALQSFEESSAEIAKATMYGDLVERSFATAFDILVEQSERNEHAERDQFAKLVIFNMLERVGDQAVNICEETVFAETGETKAPAMYRILFLDRDNSVLGPMALGIARKGYPNSGRYYTASLTPVASFDEQLQIFLDENGNALPGAPRGIEAVRDSWQDYYILICLEGRTEDYLANVPFRTIALEWKFTLPSFDELSAEERREAYQHIYQELTSKVRGLMETLQGEDAS